MVVAADVVAFGVLFGAFILVTAVLIVLVLRWAVQRDRVSRRAWVEAHAPRPVQTAMVLAGGGTRGAVQVGMLQVFAEHGIVPDRVYGVSVGAVNGAAFAGDPTPAGVERLVAVWRGLRGDDVYPQRRIHGPWLFLQQRASVHPNSGLRKIIADGLVFERLEDATIPFEVVVTSLADGSERWLTEGSAVDAILASAAIPAIFPPVEIDGELVVDGGVVDNVPISRAIDGGATRIFVLLSGPLVYTPPVARRPVEAMLHAIFISVHARFARELARLPDGVEAIVCAGPEEGTRDYTDFSDTESLLAAGRAEAEAVLRRHGIISGPAPEDARVDGRQPATSTAAHGRDR